MGNELKPALNTLAFTLSGGITPTGQLTNAKIGSAANLTHRIYAGIWTPPA